MLTNLVSKLFVASLVGVLTFTCSSPSLIQSASASASASTSASASASHGYEGLMNRLLQSPSFFHFLQTHPHVAEKAMAAFESAMFEAELNNAEGDGRVRNDRLVLADEADEADESDVSTLPRRDVTTLPRPNVLKALHHQIENPESVDAWKTLHSLSSHHPESGKLLGIKNFKKIAGDRIQLQIQVLKGDATKNLIKLVAEARHKMTQMRAEAEAQVNGKQAVAATVDEADGLIAAFVATIGGLPLSFAVFSLLADATVKRMIMPDPNNTDNPGATRPIEQWLPEAIVGTVLTFVIPTQAPAALFIILNYFGL